MSDHHQTRTVEIPERTALALSQRLAATEFESLDEYVTFALEELVAELDRQQDDPDPDPDTDDDRQGDEALQNRLESLGYL